jgi:hypothetical protein
MSISSISASTPVNPVPPPAASASKTPDAQTAADTNDASTAQPPVQAPLPPGQGTRIDQLA